VTNGYALAAARAEVAPLLDAANLVLLGDAETYRRRGLDPAPPRDFAAELRALGAHVELSLVVLPGENDGSLALDEVAALAARLDAPIHVTSPVSFELAAPVKTMLRVAEDLRARAPHVYLSTMYGGDPTTRCSRCKAVLVERTLARTTIAGLKPDGTCAACGAASPLRS
jgi:pyruvate formate lyase activating enzyme